MSKCDEYDIPSYPSELEAVKQQNKLLIEQVERMKQEKVDAARKYLPTLGELLDRLTIVQIKEVKIPEHKDEYAVEIASIVHDINQILSRGEIYFTAEMLRALVVLAQYNLHIWHNESNFRNGIKEGNNLELTHGLNSIRCFCKNKLQEIIGGRKDYKLDNVEAFPEWVPSW